MSARFGSLDWLGWLLMLAPALDATSATLGLPHWLLVRCLVSAHSLPLLDWCRRELLLVSFVLVSFGPARGTGLAQAVS